MKKAKNEFLRDRSRFEEVERSSKGRKFASAPKQKKHLSIYDNFEDEEDDFDANSPYNDDSSESIWDYFDDDDEK